jgi:uncharacterized membrane protein YecN with MAPEG domain
LSFNVIILRAKNKISFGDGSNQALGRAIRAHGNFAEYSPLALILIACLEVNGCWSPAVFGLSIIFIAGRIIHASGIVESEEDFKKRILGMKLTFASLGLLAAANLLTVVFLTYTTSHLK